LISGLGFYFIVTGINLIAGTVVFNPIAIMVFVAGAIMILAIGIELSNDIMEDTANGSGDNAKQNPQTSH
jgi:hypothetical protein